MPLRPLRRSTIALVLASVAGSLGAVACEHAELSLPSGHPEGETPKPKPLDPAKVPAGVVFFRAPAADGRALYVPFACFDPATHAQAAGEACARIPVPRGAAINCVGGGSFHVARATRVACDPGSDTTWAAVEVPGAACDLATWASDPPLPEVIELPHIEPKVSPEERASLERMAPSPLELKQAITLDLDGDGASERLFTTRGGLFLARAATPGTPSTLVEANHDPSATFRVLAVTDVDHDLRPEIWVLRTRAGGGTSPELGFGVGSTLAFEHITSSRAVTRGSLACPARSAPAVAPAPMPASTSPAPPAGDAGAAADGAPPPTGG